LVSLINSGTTAKPFFLAGGQVPVWIYDLYLGTTMY
jgi:hypothetical protein